MSGILTTQDNINKIREVAVDLQGTCQSLDGALEKEFGEGVEPENFDTELLQELDSIVMLCESCGWWCETHELGEDQNCEDCAHE